MTADSRRKTLFALLAGAATAVAMPGLGIGPIAFVAFVPLFIALESGKGFWMGFLTGVVFFAIDLRWLLTLYRFNLFAVPGYILLVAYLATYVGVFGLFMSWLLRGRLRRGERKCDATLLILAPLLFILLEILRAHGPLGTCFCSLYHSLYRLPSLIQIAAITGPWGISAAIVFVNASFYLALRKRPIYLVGGLGMVGFLAAFSFLPIPPDGGPLAVAVVSSDVCQEVKLDGRNLFLLLEDYVALGEEAIASKPDLVVFPESILPGYILRDERLLPEFTRLAKQVNSHVLFGTGDFRDGEIYNSVVLLSPEGKVLGTYDMVHPVPFAEIIPARGFLERIGLGRFIDSLLPQDLALGEGFTPIEGIGTPICFESTFPTAAREFIAKGATLLVTVTNDAWFAGSSELYAHFAAAVFRAVETRRYLIQAANGGVSGVIDPRGRILRKTVGREVIHTTVAERQGLSLYTRWGEWPLYSMVMLGGLATLLWRRKKEPSLAKDIDRSRDLPCSYRD